MKQILLASSQLCGERLLEYTIGVSWLVSPVIFVACKGQNHQNKKPLNAIAMTEPIYV